MHLSAFRFDVTTFFFPYMNGVKFTHPPKALSFTNYKFGKLLFTWLSLVMSMMVSFVLSFFPRDVLDEILKLIESVSEDFPSYSFVYRCVEDFK